MAAATPETKSRHLTRPDTLIQADGASASTRRERKETNIMKIYGHPLSTCTRKVLMTLAETSTPYDFVLVDFAKGEHKKEPHVHRQPFGRVPALEDDGFAMFESRAMCRYLNEKAAGKLVPADPKGRAKMEQWISVETSEFTPNAMKFVYQHIFHRPQEQAVLDAAGKGLDATCSIMDKQLAETPFLAGSEFSLADVCFMPYVEYVMATPAKEIVAKHRNVMAWWNKISERPAWKKATSAS
jgi:glutathione S-transferase